MREPVIETLSRSSARPPFAPVALAILTALAWPAARLSSQSVTVTTENGDLKVRAPGFHFIAGEPLARLKDGQSVRVELVLRVLGRSGGPAAVERRQACVLSYDLWEERFAVALPAVPSRTISHLTAAAAEAWCLQQLAVPVSALGGLGGDLPFWIRLEYRALDGGTAPARDEGGLTLWGLIDVLSRRRQPGEVSQAIEAGPFRLPE